MISKSDYTDTFSILRWLGIVVSLIIVFFVVWTFFLKSPTKIIENYEWFHQSYASHRSYVNKIATAKTMTTDDKDEAYRIRQELAGLQNLCYNGVEAYNARAAQFTTKWAQDGNLPQTLSKMDCQ
jgi:hypothetical protein